MENLPKALGGVYLLRWIVTYPVDKVIRSLSNWGLAIAFSTLSFCRRLRFHRFAFFKLSYTRDRHLHFFFLKRFVAFLRKFFMDAVSKVTLFLS